MSDLAEYSIGLSAGIIGILALFFLYHKPELQKEYKRGLAECTKEIDTVVIKGDTIFTETPYYVYQEKEPEFKDSVYTAKFDTLLISNNDSLRVRSTVKVKKNLIGLDQAFTLVKREILPDTVKIIVPNFITVVETETNWFLVTLAYVLGIVTSIIISLL